MTANQKLLKFQPSQTVKKAPSGNPNKKEMKFPFPDIQTNIRNLTGPNYLITATGG
jgi:hypothetical protein